MVFSDIKMPDMDGYEFFEELKKIDSDVKVVLVTGHNDEEKSKKALQHGLLQIVDKPIAGSSLLDIASKNGC